MKFYTYISCGKTVYRKCWIKWGDSVLYSDYIVFESKNKNSILNRQNSNYKGDDGDAIYWWANNEHRSYYLQ